jgi:Icc-related predicted phosphoesterase
MVITVVSDLHIHDIKHNTIAENIPHTDGFITLGDIPFESLKFFADMAKFYDRKIYGVYGNHDHEGMFEELGIIRLDTCIVELGDKYTKKISITGLSGSSKYKEHDFMLTQSESLRLAKKLPKVDILFSHDCAAGSVVAMPKGNNHCGLKGLRWYERHRKPILHVFGHHHKPYEQKTKYTNEICVYQEINLHIGADFRETKDFYIEHLS